MGWCEEDELREHEIGRRIETSIARLREALVVIRDMPLSEQDNMISANMRKVAAKALADDRT